MAYEDFIKQYRSGRNPITGEPNLYRELTDQTIWDAAQAEMQKVLDIECRRRLAAEELRDECVCCHDDNCKGCILLYKWQQTVTDYNKKLRRHGNELRTSRIKSMKNINGREG